MKLTVPDLNNQGSEDRRLCYDIKQDGLSRKVAEARGIRATSRDGSVKEAASRRDGRKENAGLPRRFWGS